MRLVALLATLLCGPTFAFATTDVCLAARLTDVIAQGPCTIGDLTFDFTNYFAGGDWVNGFSGGGEKLFPPEFVPITGLEPGFDLLFPRLASCPLCDNPPGGLVNFSYTVSSSDGYLTGSALSVNPNILMRFGLGSSGGEFMSAELDVNSYYINELQLFGQPLMVTQTGADPMITTSPPVQTLSGNVSVLGMANSGNGTVIIDAMVELTFAEVVVPEPQSVFLLATVAALLFLPLRRLARKRPRWS